VTSQAPTYTFKTDIEMSGPVADLQEFDSKYKEHEKRRRELKMQQTMQQSQISTPSDLRGTTMAGPDQSMISDIEQALPTAKRQ